MSTKFVLLNYNKDKICKSRPVEMSMENESNSFKYYAVLATDQNMDYLFLLPITALTWKRIGIRSMVFLAGSYEDYARYADKRYIVETLMQIGAHITYVDSKKLSWTTIAQTSRLYAAGFPIADTLDPDNTILITADADMFTFNLKPHLPDFSRGQKIRTYPPDCCPPIPTPKGDRKIKHYAINTIAMSVGTWREVMGSFCLYFNK
uniref:Nucleotide-diphospho-sugar transferase domain-containing protein n=1 Tax=Acrobeloides nanus TaxID=290746 RepID=A0A914C6J1_9BILA